MTESDSPFLVLWKLSNQPGLLSAINVYMEHNLNILLQSQPVTCSGSRDGALVRAVASNQCSPGLIPKVEATYGLSLLLIVIQGWK